MRNQNKDYRKIIQSQAWRNLRLAYMSQHPLCEDCLERDKVTAATEVHHIKPIEAYIGDYSAMCSLAYDPNNLRALCRSCHVEVHRVLMSNSRQANKQRQKDLTKSFAKRFLDDKQKK